MTTNPLLAPISSLLDYAAVRPEHIESAIPALIEEARAAVEKVATDTGPATWQSVIEPLEDASERLWRAWSVAGHLNGVLNTPEIRNAYNACLPAITAYSTWVGLHKGLYAQYRRLHESQEFATLPPARQRIVELALRDFRLSGVELEGEARERYSQISDEAAQVSQKFSENALDAVDQWELLVSEKERLAGIPDDVLAAARAAAQDSGQEGWKLTLKMPCYLPVMQHARDRDLRAQMYRGYATIASEQGDARFDNSSLIERLLALRAEEASLLGFGSFADMRLETRMADSPSQVLEFLHQLASRARPYGERDLEELKVFARDELGITDLQPWDVAFVSERLREARYAYSEEEVRQYFTEDRVLQGLFQVVGRLFGISLQPISAPVWHPEVRVYDVRDAAEQSLGTLYLDLHARQGKQSGAWVDSERSRRRKADGLQTPVVYLTCNFTPPHNGRPSLLTHDDVITLFHESGHALHALLSKVDDPAASPFASVEWDAIELPSQFMENFCWEWTVVQSLSAHVETGDSLPRALYDKMLAARNFQSGMQMLRQIEFALFDMLIHRRNSGLSITEVLETLDEVRREVAVLLPPSWHRFPHNFSHLFAGGYGAGYYSYKWAEVLSADAYAAFEESAKTAADGTRDTLDAATGRRFLDEILAVGGTRPAADSFRAFRGREPTLDALLRHSGMVEDVPVA
ncbi:MAG TPA: M3 family metallopeptidase [Burkholderiaceae bacterium]|nr:M3 family metallopeptidase [Burkholderiaceae bacterium]